MKKGILISVTIGMLMLASLSLTGCLDDNGPTQDTPEGALELYAESENSDKRIRYTDFSASDHEYVVGLRDELEEDDMEEWDSWKILSVTYRVDFEPDLEEVVEFYEGIYEKYDMNPEDFALIEYEFTQQEDGEEKTDTGDVMMVEIDGKWYVFMFPLFAMLDDWGDDWGDDEGTPVLTGAMSVHSRDIQENTLVMRITSMRSPSSAPVADVSITVFNETGEQVTPTQEWIFLPNDPDVSEGARLRLEFDYDVTSFRNYEIELRIDGSSGSITHIVS